MIISTPTKKFMRTILVMFATALVGFFITIPAIGYTQEKISKSQLESKIEKEWNIALQNRNNRWRRSVEDMHITVEVWKAYVEKISIITSDGKNDVTDNNISDISAALVFHWDGWFHKNGITKLQLDYHYNTLTKKWDESIQLTYTDAWVTPETIEAAKIGFTLAPIIIDILSGLAE